MSTSIPVDPLVISDYSAKKKNRKQNVLEVEQLAVVISSNSNQFINVNSSNEINSCMKDAEATKLCPSPSAEPGSGTPPVGAGQTEGHRQGSGEDSESYPWVEAN